jgi:hypothetical protein
LPRKQYIPAGIVSFPVCQQTPSIRVGLPSARTR